ncbi:glutamate synthase large subunit [Maricaulis sp.]|uniref:glutamate synthase large subunit n=1 Tax=Maricaulis sp. TaxID=1486257 RepID=UPI000C52010F|nr:glutamate synthase large subunit [Maricaulis sp.]MAC89100.1 glutamate synthase large subunit [Maricaulis sp.]
MTNKTWSEAAHRQGLETLTNAGLIDPRDERDACGVGLIADMKGRARRDIVELAIDALKAVWHRGAVDADGLTGDGAGLRVGVPQEFFKAAVARTGHEPERGDVIVGMVFLPRTDFAARERARAIIEAEILREGFAFYGWRQPPIDTSVLGDKARATLPEIEQVLFRDPRCRDSEAVERVLYIVRRRIERRAREENLRDLYVCSLSSRDIIYKGLFRAEDIDAFYPDLQSPEFISPFAIFHQRYSTNTFPEWRLAQPFRMLAHNGEINTIRGNINWMKSHEVHIAETAFADVEQDVKPVIQSGASDSAALDQTFEILVRAGRSAPMTKTLLIPEAWSKRADVMPEGWSRMYEYCNAVMEPWDGPAAIAAFDGRWAIAGLDRNGLRPMRYALTNDDIFVAGSETGMAPVDPATVTERGSITPGRLVALDIVEGKFFREQDILNELSEQHPYTRWLGEMEDIEPIVGPGAEDQLFDDADRPRRQAASGFTFENIELVIKAMAEDGKEAVGSMGDDAPLAVLSESYRPLSHFFRQNFSQVTNPPIDPLREGRVMGLKTRFRNLGNILGQGEARASVLVLESPILSNGSYERWRDHMGGAIKEIDCLLPVASANGDGQVLRAAIDEVIRECVAAVRDGAAHLVLTDHRQDSENAALPMVLVAGAVHSTLTREGLRNFCSLNVRAGECFDAHYAAVLIGLGATTVNPYLAFDTVTAGREAVGGESWARERAARLKTALDGGLLKILSKMGISIISSYRGGCNFEVLGLSRALVEAYLPGVVSRISGIGLPGLEVRTIDLHRRSWHGEARLPIGGFYRQRASGDRHALNAPVISALQTAVRDNDPAAWKQYGAAIKDQGPIQLRDLMDMRPIGPTVGLDRVESINGIRRRFVTPGMSLGALSPEAHGALNVAMNRIGAKSVSGEGGEAPARYKPLPNGDNMNSAVKQIASGRFGVTAQYLGQCREMEIKVAQGAKPGEGGQLPGFKVTEFIARMRLATPGVSLISPPPHHDIYSIEDLAQLIYDLKQINPTARVGVKLVAAAGVGAVAAGVAKANADIINISGSVGGTGAAALSSIKFAGGPLELGLAEAHQMLSLNGLRERVTLRADGGIRTGRDIVIAAMLGAEEFGVGTASLIALGCLMVRQCHSNTCPVGVCTQDDDLRARFGGIPDHVVNLMTFLAQDVREILADLGATSLEDIIGRADLLDQVSRGSQALDDLDLSAIMSRADAVERPARSTRSLRNDVAPALDEQIIQDAAPAFDRGEKMQLDYGVKNTDRAVGTRTSSQIVERFGPDGLGVDHLTLRLRGSAGQSLGAFSAKGLRIELDGDANDYVGKGLSGASIIVRPYGGATEANEEHAIIGNTCLYGATSGRLLAAGRAGQRFGVRNSGADAVIEGCGTNGCEYMTGGTAVILGPVGDNFAAGMTGGDVFIYDPDRRLDARLNRETVLAFDLEGEGERRCLSMIESHAAETGSRIAARLLAAWPAERQHFVHLRGEEVVKRERAALAAANDSQSA